MRTRKIVKIAEEKCTGCGLCIPNCAEGALQIVDGKAKLMSEKFCDGLGACLGHCPEDAITVIEREAEDFDEKAVEAHLHKQKESQPQPKAQPVPVFGGCPSSRAMHFKAPEPGAETVSTTRSVSQLTQWPVQLKLVPVNAPYFEDADLLVAADCVPFAYPDFHRDFMKGKIVVVGCPKLDDIEYYREKLTEIFKANSIKIVTVPYMEVPCCFGLVKAVEDAIAASGKKIPLKKVKIGIRGDIKPEAEEGTFGHFQTFAHSH
ncbi:MAG TPA: 4Fe-4S dicluster domain-containing protein [Thermodesulfobacteriota bacterium]|nr:4Fe-4S dicluster domain-containing protein [Thermodesulfobacteriota bacterium]